MSELTDFLLARIAEDEEAWCDGEGEYKSCSDLVDAFQTHATARRRIVDYASRLSPATHGERIASLLALPYADHPDYREEWKP